MNRLVIVIFLCFVPSLYAQEQSQNGQIINVLYLKIQQAERPLLSNLDPIPENLGLNGAELGVADNNTAGSFLGYRFDLEVKTFKQGDIESAQTALKKSEANYVLLDMHADEQLSVIDSDQKLYFNVCLLYTSPSPRDS